MALVFATTLSATVLARPAHPDVSRATEETFATVAPAPSAKLKKRIQRKVERCLLDRAFVYGVNFQRWPGIMADHLDALAASTTHDELADSFNEALEDFAVSHLRVITPATMAAREEGLTIGAGLKAVSIDDGQLVTMVIGGSPAAEAGMLAGDLIVEVDGTSVDGGKAYPGLIKYRLRGARGTTRTVVWERDGQRHQAEIGFDTHGAAKPLELVWKPGDIAWLTINTFLHEVYDRGEVAALFSELAPRAKGLVIDLRGNSGGRFNNVTHLASFLVPSGAVGGIITERKDFKRRKATLDRGDLSHDEQIQALGDVFEVEGEAGRVPFDGPLVVLIDGTSGSGGDLFPAIMKDTRKATLIGRTTAGALLAGQWCDLAGDFALVYPSQEILRPSGGRVEGIGVAPDIELTPRQTADDAYVEQVALASLVNADV